MLLIFDKKQYKKQSTSSEEIASESGVLHLSQ